MIKPFRDYWRASLFSDLIIKCPIGGTCLPIDDENFPNRCLLGNIGALCVECERGFSKNSILNKCERCEKLSFYNLFVVLAKLLFFLGYTLYIINQRTSQGSRMGDIDKTSDQILSVIVIDHINQLFLLFSIPRADDSISSILDLFNLGTTIVTDQVISFDCVLETERIIPPDYPLVFSKFIFAMVMPLFQIAAVLFVLFVKYLLDLMRSRAKRLNQVNKGILRTVIPPVLVVLMNLYTTLVWNFAHLINCRQLRSNEESKFLYYNTSVECWGNTHSNFILNFGLPYLIIWVAGIPICILALFLKKRKDIKALLANNVKSGAIGSIIIKENTKSTQEKETLPAESIYFLFFSFKQKAFWWVLVVLTWKLSLTFIVNFVSLDDLPLVMMIFFGFLMLFYKYFSPYVFEDFNNVQIILFFLNILLVLAIALSNSDREERIIGQVFFFFVVLLAFSEFV